MRGWFGLRTHTQSPALHNTINESFVDKSLWLSVFDNGSNNCADVLPLFGSMLGLSGALVQVALSCDAWSGDMPLALDVE